MLGCVTLSRLLEPYSSRYIEDTAVAWAVLTGLSGFYGVHFMVFVLFGPGARRVGIPLLVVTDVLGFLGILSDLTHRGWSRAGLLEALLLLTATCLFFWLLLEKKGKPESGSSGGPQTGTSPGSTPPTPPDAGKPVPVHPRPRHHLVAAKWLPPSDKTDSFPQD